MFQSLLGLLNLLYAEGGGERWKERVLRENTTLSSLLVCVQSSSTAWGVSKQVQEGCRMTRNE